MTVDATIMADTPSNNRLSDRRPSPGRRPLILPYDIFASSTFVDMIWQLPKLSEISPNPARLRGLYLEIVRAGTRLARSIRTWLDLGSVATRCREPVRMCIDKGE